MVVIIGFILIGIIWISSSTIEKKLDSLGKQNDRVIELLEEISDKSNDKPTDQVSVKGASSDVQ